jgi:hypothetical protein
MLNTLLMERSFEPLRSVFTPSITSEEVDVLPSDDFGSGGIYLEAREGLIFGLLQIDRDMVGLSVCEGRDILLASEGGGLHGATYIRVNVVE